MQEDKNSVLTCQNQTLSIYTYLYVDEHAIAKNPQ